MSVLVNLVIRSTRDVQVESIKSLFYLCAMQGQSERQQQFAECDGAIPAIMTIIDTGDYLKEFALPIMFRLVKASPASRARLAAHSGFDFLLKLLAKKYCRIHALDAIAAWLSSDAALEPVVVQHHQDIVEAFQDTQLHVHFEQLLHPLEQIMRAPAVARVFGLSTVFIEELKRRLTAHLSHNQIRISLLKVVGALLEHCDDAKGFIRANDMQGMLSALCSDEAVVVRTLANILFSKFVEEHKTPAREPRKQSDVKTRRKGCYLCGRKWGLSRACTECGQGVCSACSTKSEAGSLVCERCLSSS